MSCPALKYLCFVISCVRDLLSSTNNVFQISSITNSRLLVVLFERAGQILGFITWVYRTAKHVYFVCKICSFLMSSSLPIPLCFLQEWSWTPVRPGVRCLSARRCAVCSRAVRASLPLCPAPPVTPSSAPGAEGPGSTTTPALSSSPWCRRHSLVKAGQ